MDSSLQEIAARILAAAILPISPRITIPGSLAFVTELRMSSRSMTGFCRTMIEIRHFLPSLAMPIFIARPARG